MNNPIVNHYKTINGVFVSLVVESKKTMIEIKLKKAYKTIQEAEMAITKLAKQMGFLK